MGEACRSCVFVGFDISNGLRVLESRVLRKMFDPRKMEVRTTLEKTVMKSFFLTICD
jgi:hypothetical protein